MTAQEFGSAYGLGLKKTVRALVNAGIPSDRAEDLAQTAWVRGWEKRDQLRDSALVTGWVIAIAFNLIRAELRDLNRIWPLEGHESVCEIDLAVMDADHICELCEPRHRSLVRGVFRLGRDREEMAAELGISRSAVNSRLSRALRSLRKRVMSTSEERPDSESSRRSLAN